MKKFDVTVIAISILLLALVILGFTQQDHDQAMAKFGNTEITQSQLFDAMKDKYGKRVLNQLVADELVKLEAQEKGIKASDAEVDKALAAIKQQGSEKQFQEFLKERNLDEQGLRNRIYLEMTRDKLLDQAYPVTQEDIQRYYERNKEKLRKADQPIPTLEQAAPEIREKLAKKYRENFYEEWFQGLVKKYGVEYSDPALSPWDEEDQQENK